MSKEYNAGLTHEPFLFFETRIVASLLQNGFNHDEIIEKVRRENLLQFPTERMTTRITETCMRRIEALGSEELRALLADAPSEVARQVTLYGMMKENRLVWDFMTTVIGEKYRTQDFAFSRKDLNLFFLRLQEQNDTVASWTESTVKKIMQILTRCLAQSGFLDSTKAKELNLITIVPELEDEIRANNDKPALPAFNCFR